MEQTNLAPAPIVSITPEQQRGWVTLGHYKAELAKRHNLKTLELQKIIAAPGTTITEIETSLTKYKGVHAEMVKDGQAFRKLIDEKILQTSLSVEKQYAPKTNEDYLLVEKKYTDLRIEADKAARQGQAAQQERIDYKTHIQNEYLAVVNDLRIRALTEINTMYVNYLKGSVKQPDVDAVKQAVSGLIPRAYVKFNRNYVSNDEAGAILKTITKPDFVTIFQELVAEVDNRFASYQHDLAANTVQQVEQAAQEEIKEIQTATAIDTGVNLMAAKGAAPIVEPEGKKIKRSLEYIVEGGEAWHLAVITAYLKNPLCRNFITVKKLENLTIGQMSAALSKFTNETGDLIENLQYRKLVK